MTTYIPKIKKMFSNSNWKSKLKAKFNKDFFELVFYYILTLGSLIFLLRSFIYFDLSFIAFNIIGFTYFATYLYNLIKQYKKNYKV